MNHRYKCLGCKREVETVGKGTVCVVCNCCCMEMVEVTKNGLLVQIVKEDEDE